MNSSDFTGPYRVLEDENEILSSGSVETSGVAAAAVQPGISSGDNSSAKSLSEEKVQDVDPVLNQKQSPTSKGSILKGLSRRSNTGSRFENQYELEPDAENSTTATRSSRVTFSRQHQDEEDGEGTERVAAAEMLNTTAGFSDADNTTLLLGAPSKGKEKDTIKSRRLPPPLTKLKSHLDLYQLGKNEVELKANLYFHIGNPIKRWKIERVIPVKLILQLAKTICLIVQVSLFTTTIAHLRAEFFYNSREVFENHFFLNFSQESPRGTYTAFSIPNLFDSFDHICTSYFRVPEITIGGYDFEKLNGKPFPVKMTLRQYTEVDIDATTFRYTLNGRLNTTVFYVTENQTAHEQYLIYSKDHLFNRFYDMVISFPINNIRIVHTSRAECFAFEVKITFTSVHDSGKINYYLRETHEERSCNATIRDSSKSLDILTGFLTFLDIMLILMSLLSIFLLFTSLRRALILGRAMGVFYRDQLHIKLSWFERKSLFSGWYILNFLSDILIIVGTAYKIALNHNLIVLASPTRVLLGTAILFQAGVILRYVSYFQELNALNRTLYLAFPELLKFMLCAGLLFLAFSLTGFIVLGPFHVKFQSFYETFETLFGLLNGDDIYTTYDLIDIDDDPVAYIYSRIFLYAFLILFIYFVLNLFTSLVITAYEASQHIDNAAKNEVRKFVFSGPLTPNGVALRDVTLTKKYVDPQVILKKRDVDKGKSEARRKRTYSFADGFATAA